MTNCRANCKKGRTRKGVSVITNKPRKNSLNCRVSKNLDEQKVGEKFCFLMLEVNADFENLVKSN